MLRMEYLARESLLYAIASLAAPTTIVGLVPPNQDGPGALDVIDHDVLDRLSQRLSMSSHLPWVSLVVPPCVLP